MEKITGKTLVTTDWHFGIKSNSISRLNILVKVVNEINRFIKGNKIRNLVFMGDLFHNRNNLSVQTIDIALKCINTLAKSCKVYLIIGNHDLFNKNSVEVNSLNMFRNTKNVTVIDHPTEYEMNGEKVLMCPWLSELSNYHEKTYDKLFGHFDISFKFLVASYIESNTSKNITTKEVKELIEKDEMFRESELDDLDFDTEDETETYMNGEKSSDLIGSWTSIVKEKGTIFSGHIHGHKEFFTNNRKFIFVGSPYQQTRGEKESKDGFYIINEDGNYEFHEIISAPIHVDIRMSDVVKDISKFDFSVVKNSIVHKIYDVEVDRVTDAKIAQMITDNKPYEELTPDFDVAQTYTDENGTNIESVDALKKSKIEYLHNYIDNIDGNVLVDNSLDREKLHSCMEEYYNMTNEGNTK